MSKACKSNDVSFLARGAEDSGERESNTLVIYPELGNNAPKGALMSDGQGVACATPCKGPPVQEEPMAHQLVGRVTAYQGDDG